MQKSTIPSNVIMLTPSRFLSLLQSNKVSLVEPSEKLIKTTIRKIVGESVESQDIKFNALHLCKN